MSESSPSPETLFAAGLALAQGKPRREFLDQACTGRDALRDKVESGDEQAHDLRLRRAQARNRLATDVLANPTSGL